jgi:hypothetical protein
MRGIIGAILGLKHPLILGRQTLEFTGLQKAEPLFGMPSKGMLALSTHAMVSKTLESFGFLHQK